MKAGLPTVAFIAAMSYLLKRILKAKIQYYELLGFEALLITYCSSNSKAYF